VYCGIEGSHHGSQAVSRKYQCHNKTKGKQSSPWTHYDVGKCIFHGGKSAFGQYLVQDLKQFVLKIPDGNVRNECKKNSIAGKSAIKKEKAMAEALVVIAPFTILCQKKTVTSYIGIPSKKGNETLRAFSLICSAISLYVSRFRSPFAIGSFLFFNS
jgi:hypothetical protein